MNYVLLAIPVFFFLMGVEWAVSALVLRRKVYRLNDSINDLSMGVIDQVGGAFLKTLVFMGYLYIWERWRLMDMGAAHLWDPAAPLPVWVLCFLLQDLMYYWAHRVSHERNLGWATHIAHHQSEEFNLAVALRQGVFQGLFFWVFYLPLALVGFPPAVFAAVTQVNALYQFWIHTRIIGKLGPLEWVFNTPSHHRVHHGCNPKYIDRNHGGTLIIWDRLFGTFQEEEEEPQYGTVTPLKSWNPLWAQVYYFARLLALARVTPSWRDRLRLWFKPPAWRPAAVEEDKTPETRQPGYEKYDARAPRLLGAYAAVHFVVILTLAVGFVGAESAMPAGQRILAALLIFATVLSLGGIFDRRRWTPFVEAARLLALGASLGAYGGGLYGWPVFQGAGANLATLFLVAASLVVLFLRRSCFVAPRAS